MSNKLMDDGLDLFVGCLGFDVGHNDGKLTVVERDGAAAPTEFVG